MPCWNCSKMDRFQELGSTMRATFNHPSEALLTLGTGRLPAGVMSTSGVLPVVDGFDRLRPGDLDAQADLILDRHAPDHPLIDWSRRALPRLHLRRRCQECAEPWPCGFVDWAREAKSQQLATWSL